MFALTYRPAASGGWIVIARSGRIVVLEPAAVAFVESVRDALAGDGAVEAVVGALTSDGFARTPSFALIESSGLVESTDADLRVIVRGALELAVDDADGAHTVSGAGISTWTERGFTAVSSATLTVTAATPIDEVPALTLDTGDAVVASISLTVAPSDPSVPAARVDSAASDPASGPDGAATDPVSDPVAGADPPASDPVSETTVAAVPEERVFTEADPDDAADSGDTVLRPRVDPTAAVITDPPRSNPTPDSDTVVSVPDAEPVASAGSVASGGPFASAGSVASGGPNASGGPDASGGPAASGGPGASGGPAASDGPGAPAEPAASVDTDLPLGDHDGNTVLSSDLPRRRGGRSTPAPRAPEAAPRLELANGVTEPLDRPILVGRAPSVSKVPGGQLPRLVTIGTADHDISRNHAQFTLEGGTVVVTDLHSRNGTLVVLPGKGPQKLRAGEPTAVIIGTVVDFGGGVTMTVRES